jgi:hypothetical protein
MLDKIKGWLHWRGIEVIDLIKITFVMSWLLAMVGLGVYSIFA